MAIIEAKGVRKTFGGEVPVEALKDVDLVIVAKTVKAVLVGDGAY